MGDHWSVHTHPSITPEGVDLNVEIRFVAQDNWFVTLVLTPEQAHRMSLDLDYVADGEGIEPEAVARSPFVPVVAALVFYAGLAVGLMMGGNWRSAALVAAAMPIGALIGRFR